MLLLRRLLPVVSTLAACLLVTAGAAAQDTESANQASPPEAAVPAVRIAIDETLEGPAVLAAALDALPARRAAFPVAARITVPLRALIGDTSPAVLDRLDQRLALYAGRGVLMWLVLRVDAEVSGDLASGIEALRRLSTRVGSKVRLYEVLPVRPPDPVAARAAPFNTKVAALLVKQAAVELRAPGVPARILLGGVGVPEAVPEASALDALYREDIASYVDGIVIDAQSAARDAVSAMAEKEDPGSLIALSSVGVPTADAVIRHELDVLGRDVRITSYGGEAPVIGAALSRAASISDLLSGALVRLEPASAALALTPTGARGTLLYDTARFATTFVYERDPSATERPAELEVALTLRAAAKPTLRDPITAARRDLSTVQWDEGAQRLRVRVPLRDTPLIVDFNDGLTDAVNERTDVSGATSLSVGEIVARHQQTRAAQDRLLGSYVASVRMQQHFRPTSTDPGFDVVTENRYFADREGVEWEELTFSVNGTKWGSDRPPFPLLQPEKVLSPPLDLSLTAEYRYRLDGTETIRGFRCYVVRFDPAQRDATAYRGTVWIDTKTFRRVKLQATQTALSAPVVSNEEVLEFAAVGGIESVDVVLPVQTVSRQIMLIAGRNILVEKSSTFREHQLNPSDFAARRLEARRGERIMYRDTDRGIRYFVKEGDSRVVSERATTKAKAMAIGTTIDPSYGYPLPMFGINYLNFEFAGKDSQLALLFAGVLALGNVQRPKLAGTPFDASVDFFLIAVPGSDRLYGAASEREGERVLTWPLSAGANIGYQFTSFQKVSANYQFRFDGYAHDRTTSEEYVTPNTTTTHGVGVGYEYRRGGYSLVANGTWFGRAAWRPWGTPDALLTSPRTHVKYSAGITKEYFLGPFSKLRVNAAYFGGQRLDRFSQYLFGLFDETRIHGVPSSGVRFGELAMLRGSYSFNVFEQYRFDVFVEGAAGRNRDTARPLTGAFVADRNPWEPITGIGTAFSLRVPWSSILRADVGKSFLPDRYRSTGSVVVQVMLLKPL